MINLNLIDLKIYITKFSLSLIAQHPDFASNLSIMNVLPSGSYNVIIETGMPALVQSSPTFSPTTITNIAKYLHLV